MKMKRYGVLLENLSYTVSIMPELVINHLNDFVPFPNKELVFHVSALPVAASRRTLANCITHNSSRHVIFKIIILLNTQNWQHTHVSKSITNITEKNITSPVLAFPAEPQNFVGETAELLPLRGGSGWGFRVKSLWGPRRWAAASKRQSKVPWEAARLFLSAVTNIFVH